MENLNWGYIQQGLVALAFGGLQVWWISSTLRKRGLARPRGGGRLLESLTLRQQAAANSEEQFANSPDFAKERMSAIIGALAAHRTVRSQALNSKDV